MKEAWRRDEMDAVRRIARSIPDNARPGVAAALVRRLCTSDVDAEVRALEEIVHYRRWGEARALFDTVRKRSLLEATNRDLFLLELATKVTYNAAGYPAAFDENSFERFIFELRTFVNDHDIDDVWSMLTENSVA